MTITVEAYITQALQDMSRTPAMYGTPMMVDAGCDALVSLFATVVLGLNAEQKRAVHDALRRERHPRCPSSLSFADWLNDRMPMHEAGLLVVRFYIEVMDRLRQSRP